MTRRFEEPSAESDGLVSNGITPSILILSGVAVKLIASISRISCKKLSEPGFLDIDNLARQE